MARLTALPSIDIIRGFKGTLDFYLWRGLACVRAWPRWRPARQSDASKAAALLFGAIIQAFNLTHATVLESLREEATAIPRTPRDIYVSGVFGNLHEYSPPPPPPPPPEEIMIGSWLNTETADYSGSAYAWKGNYVKPMRDIEIQALAAKGDWPQGITLKFGLFTVAGGVITSILHKSDGITLPGVLDVNPSEARIWEMLDPAWQLSAGTIYLLIVGRSDGPDNYALPVPYPNKFGPPPFPAYEITPTTGRIAKAEPQVGDPVNSTSGVTHMSAVWQFV